jgi:hypothetical protein
MTDEFRAIDIQEFLKQTQDERDERLENGIQTSEHILSFDPSNLTIQIRLKDNPNAFYREVDLEECIDANPHSALSTVTVDNFEQVEVTDGSQMGEMGGSWTQRKLAYKL